VPARAVATGGRGPGARQQLRVALLRRSAAHGHQPTRPLPEPGHRVTGDRSQRSGNWTHPQTRVGYDYAHAIVDDHSRLAYVEHHDDERAETVTAFVERRSPSTPSTVSLRSV
jgi:hypothetical protein